MNRAQDNKRKRQESNSSMSALSEADRAVLNVIKKKEEMAIWARDIKNETKLPDNVVNKSLKNLLNLKLIKEAAHIQFKSRKYYIAAEFEPSSEVTGGSWYVDGNLDKDFIDSLKNISLKIICKLKVATVEGVTDFIKKKKLTTVECTSQQIREILKSMVMDNKIIETKSDGLGDYHGIPIGEVCYRCLPAGALGEGLATGKSSAPAFVTTGDKSATQAQIAIFKAQRNTLLKEIQGKQLVADGLADSIAELEAMLLGGSSQKGGEDSVDTAVAGRVMQNSGGVVLTEGREMVISNSGGASTSGVSGNEAGVLGVEKNI